MEGNSAICRVHWSEHRTIHDAKRFRVEPFRSHEFHSRRTSTKSEVAESLLGESSYWWNRSNYKQAEFVLGGLFGFVGSGTICRSWLCSVRLTFWQHHIIYITREEYRQLTQGVDSTVCQFLTSITILIFLSKRAWISWPCALMNLSGGFLLISKGFVMSFFGNIGSSPFSSNTQTGSSQSHHKGRY